MLHKIIFLGLHTGDAPPASSLTAVKTDGVPFDITAVRNGHCHVFFDDQVFELNLGGILDNFGPPLIAVAFFQLRQFLPDQLQDKGLTSQNLFQPFDGH